MNALNFGPIKRVLCIGAHCDDIEIGCGATLLRLLREHPGVRCDWVIFAGEPPRDQESRTAAAMFSRDAAAPIGVEIHDFRASFFPAQYSAIKEVCEQVRARHEPDLIFTHCLTDRHQDHRLLAELTWNSFRSHTILEYEIPKYEGDLVQPNLFVPAASEDMDRKVEILMSAFPSQLRRGWFTADTFRAIARLRGIECASPSGLAEAFVGRKIRV